MKYLQLVIKALKPKVKRYGFERKDVESFAATIAKKLDIEEDASDEDVANAIENAIDDAIPYIEAAQKHSSRIVRRKLEAARGDDDDDDEDDDDEDDDDDTPGQVEPWLLPHAAAVAGRRQRLHRGDDDRPEGGESVLPRTAGHRPV